MHPAIQNHTKRVCTMLHYVVLCCTATSSPSCHVMFWIHFKDIERRNFCACPDHIKFLSTEQQIKMMKPTINVGSHLKASKAATCPRVTPRGIIPRVAAPERAAPAQTVAPAHPEVLKLVLDKLKYQVGQDAANASANEAYRASGKGE